jgi:hypothetical protein
MEEMEEQLNSTTDIIVKFFDEEMLRGIFIDK